MPPQRLCRVPRRPIVRAVEPAEQVTPGPIRQLYTRAVLWDKMGEDIFGSENWRHLAAAFAHGTGVYRGSNPAKPARPCAGFWLLPLIDPHRYSGPQIAISKEAIMSKLVWASALLCFATMSVPTVAQQSCEKKCMQRCSESATGGGTAQSACMSRCMNEQGKCPD